MTANQNSVSARTATPASAIQARASSQSAAIALLGAGTSSLAQGENSFAQSLQSEAKRQTSPTGLFSVGSNSAKLTSRADRPRENELRRQDSTGIHSASPAQRESNAETIEKGSRPTLADADERGSTASDASTPTHALVSTPPTTGPVPTAASATSSESSSASEANAADRQPNPGALEQKPRQPSDPLRLIVPQQQTPTQAPSPASQDGSNQAAATTSVAVESTARQSAARTGENTTKGVGPTPQTGVPATSGIGATMPAGMAPATTSSHAGASISSIATAASGGSQGGAPIDQVVQPRIGSTRPLEQPVVLKLKVTQQASGSSVPLSETEIKAAETQIGRGLTAAFRQNTPQVTLWMSPESLGKVRIHLTFDQGTISARFEATSQATKELLSQNMGALRDALQSRGLTAQQIEVVSIPDWSNQSGSQSGSAGGREANEQPPQQSSAGDNPSGQGGQPRQGNSEHSKAWTSIANLENTSQGPIPASEAQISLSINPRLMNLQAHLELDAVA